MKVKKPSALLLSSVGIILLLVGCVTFESPKVLEEGEQSFTISTSGLVTSNIFDKEQETDIAYWPGISAALRTHVAKDLDTGLKLSWDFYGNAIADLKYQLLTHPFYLAIGLGGGVSFCDCPNKFQPILQALVIGGTDSFYVGVKPIYNPASAAYRRDYELDDFPLAGGVVVGWYELGKKQRLILETSVGASCRSVFLFFGAGWRSSF